MRTSKYVSFMLTVLAAVALSASPVFAGDRAKIAKGKVNLMRGREVIAPLTQGEEIVVKEVQGQWLGASVQVDGQVKSGWVLDSQVVWVGEQMAPTRLPGEGVAEIQQRTTMERRHSSYMEEVVTPLEIECPTEYSNGGVNSNWRDPFGLNESNPSLNSTYPAYEVDPNIHEWRPWTAN